jgi:hypothetical protein
MDAFRAAVISYVYSGNRIGLEGMAALAEALEQNSSLMQLYLDLSLDPDSGADSAACTQWIILTALQKQRPCFLRWKRR